MDKDDIIIFIIFLSIAALLYEFGAQSGIREHQIETVKMGYGYWESNEKGYTKFKWVVK